MTKKDTSLEVKKIGGIELPDFMKDEEILGTDALAEFVVPPRIKVVQKNSEDELLAYFKPGTVILTPANSVIAEYAKDDAETSSFNFVPLYFYVEWATQNPIALKGQEPMFRYRTTDPSDPIVAKARNKDLREEIIPGTDYKMRHVEIMNYIVMLVDHELEGTPASLSFSKGEWFAGSKFAGLIKMRKAPLFGCAFTANICVHKNNNGQSWFGIDISNPSNRTPFVEKEQYGLFKSLHLEFEDHHKNSRLKTDLSDDTKNDDPAETSAVSDEF